MDRSSITARGIFLVIGLLAGTVLLSRYIGYQRLLSTGDHGLVLYAAEATLRGEMPYRDYHYFYGPLMPYYYGLMLLLFGDSINAVLIGELLLRLTAGILIYIGLSLFVHPVWALTGSIWFWVFNQEFYYTYNHIGLNVMSLLVFTLTAAYLRFDRVKYLRWALAACLTAGLIKLNFGMALTLCAFLSMILINAVEKRPHPLKLYAWTILGLPALILLANAMFLAGLPFHIVRQCFQYFGNDAVLSMYPSLPVAFAYLGKQLYIGLIENWYSEFLLVIVAVIGMSNIHQMKRGGIQDFGLKTFLTFLGITLVFMGILLHEYFLSGIEFRSYYAFPFLFLALFFGLGHLARQTRRFIVFTITACLCLAAILQFTILQQRISAYRNTDHYLPVSKARVFVTNREPWAGTVAQTVLYLKENLKDNELFLALPYEPLYYYLLDRKSPTRQLALFKFLQIPPEQDLQMVRDLERQHINWVVISNRSITTEVGLGVFGVDYAPALAQYIGKNFEVVTQFGDWNPRPSWAWNHAVRILKRKGTR